MSSSISDTNKFKQFCKQASEDDKVFESFRQSQPFQEIMEHVSVEIAKQCIWHMKDGELLSNLPRFKTNDSIGNPNMIIFEQPIGKMAPTTIRYIKILYDLYRMFGDLSGKNIVEIGTGYGGQAKIIHDAFDVESYTAVDLPECLGVMKKYLGKFGINDIEYDYKDKNYDLVISNYAFPECSKNIQDIYINEILSKAKHGYMICNFISSKFGINSYSRQELKDKLNSILKITVEPEAPITFQGNALLYW